MVNGFVGETVGKPAWLEGLVAETFFGACGLHLNHRKNEKNVFCLECCRPICPHCLLPSHRSHPLLQVRRYVYHDVVRLDDLEKLIDCAYIQPYTINSAKVIFLKQRPQSRSSKSPNNICSTCERILQDHFHFCSLSCKVDHMVSAGEDLSRIIYTFDRSDFEYSQFEGLRLDASAEDVVRAGEDPTLEAPVLFPSSSYTAGDDESTTPAAAAAAAAAVSGGERTRRKKKGDACHVPAAGVPLSPSNRRKGNPHRSPFS